MILYHGTNCDIRKPDPMKGHRGTDCAGTGREMIVPAARLFG